MKRFLQNKLANAFLILVVLTLVFTLIDYLKTPVRKSGFAMGSFGGTVTEPNDNFLFYLPLAFLFFISAVLYFKGTKPKKFYLNRIPGMLHLLGSALFVVIYMYGFFTIKHSGFELSKQINMYLLTIALFGLIIGKMIFTGNLLVGLIRMLMHKNKNVPANLNPQP